MKRTAKYALMLVLGAAVVAPAIAQDNFPDVPENHWAYKELARMKQEGLLVGYPDGLFRGGRPASRYELAVAVHATWANLKGITDGLKGQIDDILNRLSNAPTKADIDNLRSALEALQGQVKVNSDDIAGLRRLIDEFSGELKRLGADVDQMKRDIAGLDARVTKLEKSKLPFDVTGDLNLVALGAYSGHNGEFGESVDGRPEGYGRGDYSGKHVGATRDLTILHEGALSLTSNNETGPKFHATFVMGNMLGGGSGSFSPFASTGTAFGNQSRPQAFSPFNEADSAWYLQDFNVSFDTSLAGLAFNAKVGRVGYKVSPMMFQRPDNTPYYANDRWDNGNWTFDGAILGFNFGSAKLDVFGGRNSNRLATDGTEINPMAAGQTFSPFSPGGFGTGFRPVGINHDELPIDQSLGAHLSLPLTSNGTLNLAYLWLDSNTVINSGSSGLEPFNGVSVWGGDAKFNLGSIVVDGGYSKSDVRFNNDNVVDKDNAAWFVNLGFERDKWGLKGGYKSIDPLYAAPGDWGRIGSWYNPTDIEGFYAKAFYDLTEKWRLSASGEWYRGRDIDVDGVTGLTHDDKINRYVIGLEYKMAANYNLALGYETVMWDLADRGDVGFSGGTPRESWWNIGFGFDLSDKAKLSLLWQISDYNADNVSGFDFFGQNRARGGIIATQLSVRF